MGFARKMLLVGYMSLVSVLLGSWPVPVIVYAQQAEEPALVIRQVKITGDEAVVLQANRDISNLSDYWVGYIGNDNATSGSIVPTQQLPAFALAAGQAVLMTSDGASTCDAVLITRLSFSLADTKGTLVVRQLQSNGVTSTFTTVDQVNWAKPSANATTTAGIDLRKELSSIVQPIWYHDPSLSKPWRVGSLQGCTMTLAAQGAELQSSVIEWTATPQEPLAIIEQVDGEFLQSGQAVASVNSNAGLAPPLITELLPNPPGTGNDTNDEYIELYNSNDAVFDLSGFTLQTGLSTVHNYLLPVGTQIQPKSYLTLYSAQTGLSMSNTSGKATLLDTTGDVIAQSDPYDSAPDGQAWALGNGTWYWTTKPSPSATNVISRPIVAPATGTKRLATTNKKTAVATVTKATKSSTAKAKAATTKNSKIAPSSAQTGNTTPLIASSATKIHPGVLATVAMAAVGYGLYVYRRDIANTLHKLRRH